MLPKWEMLNEELGRREDDERGERPRSSRVGDTMPSSL